MTLDTRNLEPKKNYTNRSEMLYKTNTNSDTRNIDLESQTRFNYNDDYEHNCLSCCIVSCCGGLAGIFACGAGVALFGLMIGLIFFNFVLHIVSLVYIGKHKHDMYCDNDIISPYTWMMVYSIIGLITCVISFNKDNFINIIYAFFLAWLIVGAVMFWGTCEDAGMPKSINTLFYINLISGFIMICCGTSENNKKDNKENVNFNFNVNANANN